VTYKVGLPALAPEAQVAWIDKNVEGLRKLLREAAYLLEDGLKTEAELSQLEWDSRAQDLIDEVNASV
jgi:hypothetical protein